MDDAELPPPVRAAVFLTALVWAAAAAWTVGRMSPELVPVPELQRPAVLGGSSGPDGTVDDRDGPQGAVLVHGGAHDR
jgi:hypothetical protein